MRDFPPDRPGPKGILINEIRTRVKSVVRGSDTSVLKALLGEPDQVTSVLSDWLPSSAVLGIEDLGSSFFDGKPPRVEYTWVYVNPYRSTVRHCFGICGDILVAVWEVNGNSVVVYG